MWLFAGFLAIPLIEIALFVTLGGWLGLWPTLAVVIATAMTGVLVIRRQGVQAMDGLRKATQLRRDPIGQMADSALVALAGILLILPGFLTDTFGILLLIPPLRALLVRGLAARTRLRRPGAETSARRRGSDVIDGEFFEIDHDKSDDQPIGRPPSGWTQH